MVSRSSGDVLMLGPCGKSLLLPPCPLVPWQLKHAPSTQTRLPSRICSCVGGSAVGNVVSCATTAAPPANTTASTSPKMGLENSNDIQKTFDGCGRRIDARRPKRPQLVVYRLRDRMCRGHVSLHGRTTNALLPP